MDFNNAAIQRTRRKPDRLARRDRNQAAAPILTGQPFCRAMIRTVLLGVVSLALLMPHVASGSEENEPPSYSLADHPVTFRARCTGVTTLARFSGSAFQTTFDPLFVITLEHENGAVHNYMIHSPTQLWPTADRASMLSYRLQAQDGMRFKSLWLVRDQGPTH